MTGWQTVEMKDSFLMCPMDNLPSGLRAQVLDGFDRGYNFRFSDVMHMNRPAGSMPFISTELAKQPLHKFCLAFTNYDPSEIDLATAIQQDRARAREEAAKLEKNGGTLQDMQENKQFLWTLDLIEDIHLHGKEEPLLEEVLGALPEELVTNDKLASNIGAQYILRRHNGFRPQG
jgi:hypothetical protein